MVAKRGGIHGWIKRSLQSDPPMSKSLIVTIFGDSLLPYVPGVWLGELTALLEPFGVNSQLARTSAFRLGAEGWLESRREGRKSLYLLTDSGRQRVEHAYPRIYGLPAREWDGNWTVIILSKAEVPPAVRRELRREFEWEGFGLAGPGVFLHPRANRANLDQLLRRLKLSDAVVVMRAQDLDGVATKSGSRLTSECWDLQRVSKHYDGFLSRFRSVEPCLSQLEPSTAFQLQTLLIHSFRRVVLHDPQLPSALLPNDWPGHAAFELCRAVYRTTFLLTRVHLGITLQESDRLPLRPASEFQNRLGGLSEPGLEEQSRRL